MTQVFSYLSRPRVWLAIALPIVVQLAFFLIMLPAVQGSEGRVHRLHIAIVSADPGMGRQIADQVAAKLPFTVDRPASLAEAEATLSGGSAQMVVAFPADFTSSLQAGHASVRYEIDPAAALMTKQLMTQVAQSMTEQLNTVAFANAQHAIAQGASAGLRNTPLPAQAAQQIATNLEGAIQSLPRSPVTADLGAAAATVNPLQAIVPLFVILLGFGGAVGAVALLWLTPATEGRWAVFVGLQLTMVIVAAVLPVVTLGLLALFGQTLPLGAVASWWALAVAYWAMLLFVAALVRLLGRLGIVLAAVALPFQIIVAGVIMPQALLPGFYDWLARFTPGPYGARTLLHVLAGEHVPASTTGSLWLVLVVSLLVTLAATWLPRRTRSAAG